MFFKFNIHQKSGKKLYFTKQTDIFMQNSTYRIILKIFRNLFVRLTFHLAILKKFVL